MYISFDDWFKSKEWFHENSARETLEPVWKEMERFIVSIWQDPGSSPRSSTISSEKIAEIFDKITGAVRNEYGE
jgi:hypothetical protein